jgi:hypothetical protein
MNNISINFKITNQLEPANIDSQGKTHFWHCQLLKETLEHGFKTMD